MDKAMKAIFEPLRQALESRTYTLVDVLDIVGSFASSPRPEVATAMAYHARDILVERTGTIPNAGFGPILAETYRRTFFDAEHAKTYGTGDFPRNSVETMADFVHHIITSLKMDDDQHAAGSYHDAPSAQH